MARPVHRSYTMIDIFDRMRGVLYLVAALFILMPSADIIVTLLPASLDAGQPAFGVAGVAANHLLSIVFGFALAAVVAALNGDRFSLKLLAAISSLAAIALIALTVSFLLGLQELLPDVPGRSLDAVEIAAWKTGFKLCSTALVLGVIGVTLLRLDRSLARQEDDGVAFLVQRRSAA